MAREGEGRGERDACAAGALIVLAPETRRTQRSVPAPLDGSALPRGGTNLPPLPAI